MTNPLRYVGRAFQAVGVAIAHGFVAVFGSDAAHQFAAATLEVLKTAAGQIALRAVTDAMGSGPDATDNDKRSAAIAAFVQYAETEGLTVADHIRDTLLQLALMAVKKDFSELAGQ